MCNMHIQRITIRLNSGKYCPPSFLGWLSYLVSPNSSQTHLHSVLKTWLALVSPHIIAHVPLPPVCLSKSWPAYTSQCYHHSFRSFLCRIHALTRWPGFLLHTVGLSIAGWSAHALHPSCQTPTTPHLSPATRLPFILQSDTMKQKYDTRSVKLVFQKTVFMEQWAKHMIFKRRVSRWTVNSIFNFFEVPSGTDWWCFVSAGDGVSPCLI